MTSPQRRCDSSLHKACDAPPATSTLYYVVYRDTLANRLRDIVHLIPVHNLRACDNSSCHLEMWDNVYVHVKRVAPNNENVVVRTCEIRYHTVAQHNSFDVTARRFIRSGTLVLGRLDEVTRGDRGA